MQKFALATAIAGLTMALTTVASFAVAAAPSPHDTPSPSIDTTSSTECIAGLGHMRSVHRADVEAINGQRITLVHVCENTSLMRDDSYGSLFTNGNVNAVRLPIARNDTLMGALDQEGLDQNDVVSLRFGGGNSIVLYVHDRSMR